LDAAHAINFATPNSAARYVNSAVALPVNVVPAENVQNILEIAFNIM
jgi:hypothetical protein